MKDEPRVCRIIMQRRLRENYSHYSRWQLIRFPRFWFESSRIDLRARSLIRKRAVSLFSCGEERERSGKCVLQKSEKPRCSGTL
jgi:hypothetical protein